MRSSSHVLALLFAVIAVAIAGGTREQLSSEGELLRSQWADLYAVEVKEVDDGGATNANPPRIRFLVLEALRGEAKPGDVLDARWDPMDHDYDWAGAEGLIEKWGATPLSGPKVGERYILLGRSSYREGVFRASPRCRYPDSEEKRAWVRPMAEGWREWRAEDERTRAEAEARDSALIEADRKAQSEADVDALTAQASDVVVARYIGFSDHPGMGRLLEIQVLRPVKRSTEPMKGETWGTKEPFIRVFALTDEDLSEVMRVRGTLGDLLVFLSPWPEGSGKTWNVFRLAGGGHGVLEATPERLDRVRAITEEE